MADTVIDQLRQDGQFLDLSRNQPELFSESLKFQLDNKTQVEILAPGLIIFSPAQQWNKDIVLSCGVHGNETAPIEICDHLVQQILTGQIALCQRVLFIFANLPAMDIAQRFVTENMNRLFSGAHSKSPGLVNDERKRAQQIEQAVKHFYLDTFHPVERFHYDLHTAIRASKNDKFAVYPFLHGKPHDRQQIAFLSACGVNTILLSESPTTTFSYFSTHQFDAHGFTVELGKVKPFGQNDMNQFEKVRTMLNRLLSEASLQLDDYDPQQVEIFRVNQVINKQQDDFKLHFADDTPNFTDFSKGTVLASESGKQYCSEHDGEAIVFPNADVAIGQRALLTVVPTTLAQ